jgi:hypothetical protein
MIGRQARPCMNLLGMYRCFILKKGKMLDKFEARSVDGIFLVMHLILEHIECSILKLTKSWRLAR